MVKKYTCYGCKMEYEDEEKATKCCSEWVIGKDGEKVIPKQLRKVKELKLVHECKKMILENNKQWFCEIEPDEKCPKCGFEWNPR